MAYFKLIPTTDGIEAIRRKVSSVQKRPTIAMYDPLSGITLRALRSGEEFIKLDANANMSTILRWYKAGYLTFTGDHPFAPTWVDEPTATGVLDEDNNALITISASISKDGTIYFMVVPGGSDPPTIEQLVAQDAYGEVTEVTCGTNDPETSTTELSVNVSSEYIVPGGEYDIYLIAEDTETPTSRMGEMYSITGVTVPEIEGP